MITETWRVALTRRDLPTPTSPAPVVGDEHLDRADWLRRERLVEGTPYLLSPAFQFDVELNEFFRSPEMAQRAQLTQQGYARDVAAFLSFLWASRDRRVWRDATEADHLAYLTWRRHDPAGPRVSDATWDREVAAVNQFYRWALRLRHLQLHPIPQTSRRPAPTDRGWAGRRTLDEQRPATYSHAGGRDRVEWLPPAAYLEWRDVGVRGYSSQGLPRPRFRGRWAARNSVFSDLMIRTGLRLQEQSALTVFDLPDRAIGHAGGYRRFWLPEAIAKGSSARWGYVPSSVLADLHAFVEIDRAAVIADAQADGRYQRVRRPLVVTDPARRVAVQAGAGRAVDLARLGPAERRQLLMEGEHGLEPAALWLGEQGWPITMSRWKGVFAEANDRCARAGLELRCHPHMLRHSFAVITLEQLQRGHLAALGELNTQQRTHYTRIFGDPLDWVRRRLGHRSVVTTQVYLHALAELEMHTRMALVPDDWEDPRDPDELAASETGGARP